MLPMSKLPTVDFIIPTLNSEEVLDECLSSLSKLDYPKRLIQAFIMDGGSKDNTLKIAKKYPFVHIYKVQTDGPEEATAVGYNHSHATYVVNYPSDNVIQDPQWLRAMIAPLEQDKTIDACETLHYEYVPSDKLLNRYFALYGMNDPVALYLKKNDRRPYYESGWHLMSKAKKYKHYYKTTFTKNNLPTVGANGFIVRTKTIHEVTKNPKLFSHIDSCVDMLENGHSCFAFVDTAIWHKTGEQLGNFFYKRRKYALSLYFKKMQMRRYHLYNPQTDRLRLALFVFFSLTLVEPTIRAIRGYRMIRDFAWFLHPFICFAMTINYVYTLILFQTFLWKKNTKANTA